MPAVRSDSVGRRSAHAAGARVPGRHRRPAPNTHLGRACWRHRGRSGVHHRQRVPLVQRPQDPAWNVGVDLEKTRQVRRPRVSTRNARQDASKGFGQPLSGGGESCDSCVIVARCFSCIHAPYFKRRVAGDQARFGEILDSRALQSEKIFLLHLRFLLTRIILPLYHRYCQAPPFGPRVQWRGKTWCLSEGSIGSR